MHLIATRRTDLLGFFICCLFLLSAVYLQYRIGLSPCPLCLVQRFIIVCLGICFLMGAWFEFSPFSRCLLHTVNFLLAAIGVVVASRQLWLEHFPSAQLSSCQAAFTYTGSFSYLHKITELLLQGTSNCGSSQWRFLNLSMPMWTLWFFILMGALALRQIYINRWLHSRSSRLF